MSGTGRRWLLSPRSGPAGGPADHLVPAAGQHCLSSHLSPQLSAPSHCRESEEDAWMREGVEGREGRCRVEEEVQIFHL